jgi:heat shock protein HtpX
MKNTVKTWVFLAALGGLLIWAGDLLGGATGMMLMLGLVIIMNFSAYWFSDKMVVKMTRARPVTEAEAPWLYSIVRRLCDRAQLPMPRLFVMPASQPNAFATGRNPDRAVVAVTEGILDVLDEDELEGVIAHEISHVGNRDILIGAVAATVAAAISMIARIAMWGAMFGGGRDEDDSPMGAIGGLLAILLAPIAALMIQMAVSRSRESHADATGAKLLGDATPLARALIKIDAAAKNRPVPDINPAVAHVFLQSPFKGNGITKLFLSHPPLEERLAQLRSLGAKI